MSRDEFRAKVRLGRKSGLVLAALLAVNLCVAGCSAMHVPVITDTIRAGGIPELPASASVDYIFPFPEPPEGKRYRRIALVDNVIVGDEGRCSFVLGRRASDGEWEIVSAAQRDEKGSWRELTVAHSH